MSEYVPYIYEFTKGSDTFYCFYDGVGWRECSKQLFDWLLSNGAEFPNSNLNKIENIIYNRL